MLLKPLTNHSFAHDLVNHNYQFETCAGWGGGGGGGGDVVGVKWCVCVFAVARVVIEFVQIF